MNLGSSLVICVGFLSFFALRTVDSNQNTAHFKKIICILHDERFLTNLSCSSRPIGRFKTNIKGKGFIPRRAEDIKVHMKVYRQSNLVFKPFLVDVVENFCDALANKPGNTYLKICLSLIGKNTTSFTHICPYEGWAFVNIASLDLSKLTNIVVPNGEYRVDIIPSLHKSSPKTFTLQCYVDVGEKNYVSGK